MRSVLTSFSAAIWNHSDQNQLWWGKGSFQRTSYSSKLSEAKARTRGRRLKQKWRSAPYRLALRSTCIGVVPPTVGWVLPQGSVPEMCAQAFWWKQPLQLRFPLLGCVKLTSRITHSKSMLMLLILIHHYWIYSSSFLSHAYNSPAQ